MANQTKILDKKVCVGDIVKVHHQVLEKDSKRLQIFSGVVISIKGHPPNKTFTVRKIASTGIGVERIWPVNSPWLNKIEIKKKGKVRRAKLYYLRKRVGKKATRVKIKKVGKAEEVEKTEKAGKIKKDEKKKLGKSRRKSGPKTPKK